jgi:hypothetical protein
MYSLTNFQIRWWSISPYSWISTFLWAMILCQVNLRMRGAKSVAQTTGRLADDLDLPLHGGA